MRGFKKFIMRGNVLELAVAVIIGAAFTGIVNALVEGIFTPLIAALFDTSAIEKAVWQVGPVAFGVGSVLAAVINFLLIAVVVYFCVILPMNKLNEALTARKRGASSDEQEHTVTELELLTEIRDLLAAQTRN